MNRLSRTLSDAYADAGHVQWYLQWRFIIRNENRTASLPSLPYRWPNGNGDVAKFLQGREKAEEWLAKYGSIYRIWSGSTPEVYVLNGRPPDFLLLLTDATQRNLRPGAPESCLQGL